MSKQQLIHFQVHVYKFCYLAYAVIFALTTLAFTSSG